MPKDTQTTTPSTLKKSSAHTQTVPINPATPTQPTPHKRTLDETVLLEMPASSFTIRLRDSNSKQELAEFAKQHDIADRTLCYSHAAANNRYTLVYGDYLTPHAAKNAIKHLPKALHNKLIIQPLKQVQHEIIG